MLVKQVPKDITDKWEFINYAIQKAAITPYNIDHMNMILSYLLGGLMDCWLIVDSKGDKDIIIGLVVTQVVLDEFTGISSMLIHTLYVRSGVSDDLWQSGVSTITKYAKHMGCRNIIGYTTNRRVLEIVNMFEGSNISHYITIPL